MRCPRPIFPYFSANAARPMHVLLLLLTLVLWLWPARAHAYAWMIRHDYTHCGQCHVDPSGSGPLTEYGRGMGEMALRTQYSQNELAEPGPVAGFLFGAIPVPEPLALGG